MKHFIAAVMAILIVACTRSPETNQALSENGVSIVFSSARYLSLVPCGCSLRPQGGIEREWSVLQKWKKETGSRLVSFSAGTSFVPMAYEFHDTKIDEYFQKAKLSTEAWNVLGLTALSPSIEDVSLGVEKLGELAKSAKFPFVSTNIVGKGAGVFKKFLVIDTKPVPLVVVGLSFGWDKKLHTADFQIIDPVASLKAVMKEFPSGPRVLVVLSSLSRAERERVISSLDEEAVFLGGEDSDRGFDQVGPRTLFANVHDRGRGLARVTLNLAEAKDSKNFYNVRYWSQAEETKFAAVKKISEVELQLKEKNSPSRRQALLREKSARVAQYKRAVEIARAASSPAIRFQSKLVELGAPSAGEQESVPAALAQISSKAKAWSASEK